jgi:myosin-crossreactive antigen
MRNGVAVLPPQVMGDSHIIFLACALAGVAPKLIPALEKLYHIDFMASTDVTGNAISITDSKPNWKMETDAFDFRAVYCDEKKLTKYRVRANIRSE